MIEIKKEKSEECTALSDDYRYPYGLQILIENDLLAQLKVQNLPLGEVVMIHAKAFVSSKSSHESGESQSVCMNFQLTEIEIQSPTVTKDRADTLYGD
jgi:hypothetical protein